MQSCQFGSLKYELLFIVLYNKINHCNFCTCFIGACLNWNDMDFIIKCKYILVFPTSFAGPSTNYLSVIRRPPGGPRPGPPRGRDHP